MAYAGAYVAAALAFVPGSALTLGAGPFILDPGETLNGRASFHPGAMGAYTALITTGLADCPSISCYGTGTAHDLSERPAAFAAREDARKRALQVHAFAGPREFGGHEDCAFGVVGVGLNAVCHNLIPL